MYFFTSLEQEKKAVNSPLPSEDKWGHGYWLFCNEPFFSYEMASWEWDLPLRALEFLGQDVGPAQRWTRNWCHQEWGDRLHSWGLWHLCCEVTLFYSLQIFHFCMCWEAPSCHTKHGIKIPVMYVWFYLKLQPHRKLSVMLFHSITAKCITYFTIIAIKSFMGRGSPDYLK